MKHRPQTRNSWKLRDAGIGRVSYVWQCKPCADAHVHVLVSFFVLNAMSVRVILLLLFDTGFHITLDVLCSQA